MGIIRNFFLVLGFSIYTATVLASPSQDLNHLLSSFRTMKANFEQTTFNESGGNCLKQNKGQVFIKKPNQVRWEFDSPEKPLFIANEKEILIYDKELLQLTKKQITDNYSPALTLLTGKIETIEQNYLIHESRKNDEITFEMQSKDGNQEEIFKLIKLKFIDNKIRALEIIDNIDQHSRFTFTNVTTNQPISPSLFTLKIPSNVDIVE